MSRMSDFSHLRQIYTLYQWNKLKTELFLRSFMKSDVQQDVFSYLCLEKRVNWGVIQGKSGIREMSRMSEFSYLWHIYTLFRWIPLKVEAFFA